MGANVAPLLTERVHFGLANEIDEMSRGRMTYDGEEDIKVKGIGVCGTLVYDGKREECTWVPRG